MLSITTFNRYNQKRIYNLVDEKTLTLIAYNVTYHSYSGTPGGSVVSIDPEGGPYLEVEKTIDIGCSNMYIIKNIISDRVVSKTDDKYDLEISMTIQKI